MEEQSDMPLIGYLTLLVAIVAAFVLGRWYPDLSYDLLIELGAATLIILLLGVVLTRANRKRWSAVKQQTEYLIARLVHRVRQGVASRAFGFSPSIDVSASFEENEQSTRLQRRELLERLVATSDVSSEIVSSLWSEEEYFRSRATDVWELLNMKNGGYLSADIVSLLTDLYVYLEDLQAHIRTYAIKSSKKKQEYYQRKALVGAEFCLQEILRITATLRDMGYSEPPRYE
ncbi:MAG: hypothetical protein ACMXYD_03625 [Candidatus Woesearchaeota archaeon]